MAPRPASAAPPASPSPPPPRPAPEPSPPISRSPRTFSCKDALWSALEQLSRELECSVDYLANEAIRSYLRQRQVAPAEPAASPRFPLGALEIEYEGRRYPVDKEHFFVGRSPGTCDLTLPHSVVSRRHLAIEYLQGHYYAVDLGSANGVHHQGNPIARMLIREGDELDLSGHKLRFFFRSLP